VLQLKIALNTLAKAIYRFLRNTRDLRWLKLEAVTIRLKRERLDTKVFRQVIRRNSGAFQSTLVAVTHRPKGQTMSSDALDRGGKLGSGLIDYRAVERNVMSSSRCQFISDHL
jgi:hypothetical protein